VASAWLHGKRYRLRVPRSDRRQVAVSTGTSDKRTVHAIERMVEQLHSRAEFRVLDAIADGRKTLLETFAEYRNDAQLGDTKQALDDVDLEPMVATWHAEIASRHVGTATKYLAQVRRLIPEGQRFPASRFRRKVLSEHIAGLVDLQAKAEVKPPISPSTRNRHRAAIRQFGRWLVEREVIDHNPATDVRAARENVARSTHYAPADVRRLVDALAGDYRVLEAVLASTGMELQAARRLRRRDVDLTARTMHAHGSKNEWRNRTCAVTESWAWPIITAHVKPLLPDALLFPDLDHNKALDAHHAAVAALRLPRSVLHDHRHSYAIALRRRGVSDSVIAKQLGHRDTVLVAKTYGRYAPDLSEVRRASSSRQKGK
jgi:integrase